MAAPLALDAGALSALRTQAKASPKAALSAAATQFEALFVQMLLKSMRDALPQDGLMTSDTSKTYQAMFDQQIAQQMSKKGIGLRQILERQLAPAVQGADAGNAAGQATDVSTPAAAAAPAHGALARATAARRSTEPAATLANVHAANAANHKIASAADTTSASAAADPTATSRVPANVKAFIERMRPHAEAAAKVVGVPADLLLAQAGLETGWGKSQPKTADGAASHNLFGLKAGRAWNGATAVASTTEYVAGALVRTVDRFRSYGSYTEAFQDFGRLITGSGRYAKAVASTDDPVTYATQLQRGGYATDPHYADKLIRAIRLVAGQGGTAGAPAQVMAGGAVNRSDEAAG